ncbi:GCN5 family acetyltransferase [Paenibacillus sp. 32O-W]|uniref:GNAT family N-acetyltransferase n=1 Tax=Paenibacillus sp. 32O-W TaxID=1695218 RepID=UPI000720C53D|nr:GNAT family N-acetyltransferase [Paenibacillus sp. 32O-W]ALS26139.1 GCN5 family acetyltransferase [Paenibacillus sp. 32O-W]
MEIRQLTTDDYEASKKLSMYAFQFEMSEEAIEAERSRFVPERYFGIFADNRLAAQLTLLPLQTYINGKLFDMGGIANVSSWPEMRRQGLVARLIRHSLGEMKRAGQTVSFLAPFSHSFYRKYGWENLLDLKKYTIETSFFPPRAETGGRVERRNEDIGLLNGIYESYAKRYNGMLNRTEHWWKTSVFPRKKGHAAVYFRADGKPSGYALYQVRQRELTVHEYIVLDDEAKKGLWTFFANHDSMVDRAYLTVPIDDTLPFEWANPRFKQEIEPYFMARIVDLKRFVEQYPFKETDRKTDLYIRVTDADASWNEAVWHIEVGPSGAARAQALSEAAAADKPVASCDIQTLTAMLIGYADAATMVKISRIGGAAEKTAEALMSVIPARTTYMTDFF